MDLQKENQSLAKELYNMKLHEEIEITELCYVVRVIGGWVYKWYKEVRFPNGDFKEFQLVTTSFVPWDNQMQ